METSQMPQGSADERENGGNHNRLTTKMLCVYQAGLRFMGTKLAQYAPEFFRAGPKPRGNRIA